MEHFELTPPPSKEKPMAKRKVFVIKPEDIPSEARRPKVEAHNFHSEFPEFFRTTGHLKPEVSRQFFSEDKKESQRYVASLPAGVANAILRHTFMAIAEHRCKMCQRPDRADDE